MTRPLFTVLFALLLIHSHAQNNCSCLQWDEKDKSKNNPLLLINSETIFCKAKGYEIIAADFLAKNETDSTELYIKKADALYKQAACKEEQLFPVYKIWARYYFIKAEYQPALDYNLKTLSIAEKQNNFSEQANILLSISQIFSRMGQAEKGVSYSRMSIPLAEKLKDSPDKVDILNKIGARYYFYYQDYKVKAYIDTAKKFYQQAIQIAKAINYRRGKMASYNKMNTLAYREKNYGQALLYIDSALGLAVPGTDENELSVSHGDKGNIFLKMGNYTDARKHADSCLYYCEKIKFPPTIANAYSLIAEIADSAGNHKDAYTALYKEKKITDSLNKADKIKSVNEVEKKYNQAKNEKTIKELSQQKLIYALLGLGGLLVAGLIAFYFRQQSLKHKHKILETEQRLNRARMNPHFFFNALTAMQRFAMKENDGKALASNLSKFSNIMRETLESTYKEYVTVKQEIEFLKEYMEIQKMRFPQMFNYSLMVDGEMEPGDVMIPSMIIQPFIENSIEHGFAGIDYAGEIRVDFKQHQKKVSIEITDNGKGLLSTSTLPNEHISRASQIIKDRIYLLNIKLKTKADFSIDNNKDGKGVIVKIHLPIIYNNENITG
jgi:tetratricopeptide (TPR) repeat protein